MNTWISFFQWINNDILALPTVILFFGTGIFLTLKYKFIQIRSFPRFLKLITKGVKHKKQAGEDTINPFHALFTAMSTTIGMGNVVGPSLAIMAGGPGALFWLLVYIFFGSVTKFAEVTFALITRTKTKDGHVIGGPMEYLKAVHPALALWYSTVMVFLFAGWSSVQSNTLASIYAEESVPHWVIGLSLAIFVAIILQGGAKRVGSIASKLVPLMFILYVSFAVLILAKDIPALMAALRSVISNILTPAAAVGGFVGATVFQSMRAGIYRGIFITEAGLGTSSIPHAMADTENPVDQGILAMCSTVADAVLSTISGLLVLVTGVWVNGAFRSTLIYEAFQMHAPALVRFVLIASITLFVLTTVMGNCFNGVQSFASLTRNRWTKAYIAVTVAIIFLGSLMPVPLVWEIMDTLLALVAIPNLIGLIVLAIRYGKRIKLGA